MTLYHSNWYTTIINPFTYTITTRWPFTIPTDIQLYLIHLLIPQPLDDPLPFQLIYTIINPFTYTITTRWPFTIPTDIQL